MAALEVHRQLLVTLGFFQSGDGYDVGSWSPCHITLPSFVIVADELHHVDKAKRWEGKNNTHWFHNIVTSVLSVFVPGNK